jgi:hypothetical protein
MVRVGLLVGVRRCRVCQSSIQHLHLKRVCCNHPRCKKAYQQMPRSQKVKAAIQETESKGQACDREVRQRYAYARLKGASEGDALTVVSRRMELRVTEVIAIVRGPK